MEENIAKFNRQLAFFKEAYQSLKLAVEQPEIDEFIKDSIVQRFEYTLEMAWKTLRIHLLIKDGINEKSPKKVLRAAFDQGYLKEEIELWDNALEARNATSHEYGAEHGNTAFEFATENHQVFADLLSLLEQSQDT